jgi:uncharacterized membrane protein YbhN (UPF0104 family)
LILVTVAFIVLVILRFGELEELAATLVEGRWEWLLAAALLQLVYYLLLGVLYQTAFAVVWVRSRLRELMPVLFASVFVNNLAPTGGISGAALFVDDAARHGESPARAAEGVLLVWVAQNVALLPVLGLGLAFLAVTGNLVPYQALGSGIFLLLVAALGAGLLLGRWQAGRLRGLLGWLQHTVNDLGRHIRRPDLLPAEWADANARELSEAASAIATRPREVACTLAIALAHTLVNLVSLYAVFMAYGQPVPLGAAAAGFSVAIVYAVLSVLPLDIGLMQGVMAVVFAQLGVPVATALAVVLVFGGLNAWLPLAVGFVFLREVRAFGGGGRP